MTIIIEIIRPCVIKVVGKSEDINIVSIGINVSAITSLIPVYLDKESKTDITIDITTE